MLVLNYGQGRYDLLIAIAGLRCAGTGPSGRFRTANRMVIPWRLSSWVTPSHRSVDPDADEPLEQRVGRRPALSIAASKASKRTPARASPPIASPEKPTTARSPRRTPAKSQPRRRVRALAKSGAADDASGRAFSGPCRRKAAANLVVAALCHSHPSDHIAPHWRRLFQPRSGSAEASAVRLQMICPAANVRFSSVRADAINNRPNIV